ncbi:hypothetical protein M9458_018691, partial [Cirrhinus mrigala]
MTAERPLRTLRQGNWSLESYVEEFFELSNRVEEVKEHSSSRHSAPVEMHCTELRSMTQSPATTNHDSRSPSPQWTESQSRKQQSHRTWERQHSGLLRSLSQDCPT